VLGGEPREPLFGLEPPPETPEEAGARRVVEMPVVGKVAVAEVTEQKKEEKVLR
jgi:hypothetical protein